MRPMIAQGLIPGERHFRWRGGEITRLEAFTDAVFAFAELELNQYESMRTKHAFYNQLAMATLGLVVAITAVLLPLRLSGLSGYLYTFIGVYYWIAGSILGRRETRVLEQMQSQSGAPASA